MSGNHVKPWETIVIKRLKKQNQTLTKKLSMATSINQRNIGHKLKRLFQENHNQWQTNQLINVLVWTYLVDFTVQWHQSWKNWLTYLQILPAFYTPKSPPKSRKTFRFQNISVLFEQKELQLLSGKKFTGIDNLPPRLLKDCGSIMSKPLRHIINLSIRSGELPSRWKAAKVTPIFKSGSRSLSQNYRPILVRPIASKPLEKPAQQALKDFENEKLLSKNQHGFRKKHSTKTPSIYFCDSVRKQMDNGKLTGAVYVDWSKAFDTIAHSVLLQKCQRMEWKIKNSNGLIVIFLRERTMLVSADIFLVQSQYTV